MRTNKQIAAGQRRTLAAMKAKLINMACEWEEQDQCCVNFIEELISNVDKTSGLLVDDGEVS